MVAAGFASDDKVSKSGDTMTGNLTLQGSPHPLTIPSGASPGKVWTSDSSGNGSWQPSSGGSSTTAITPSGDGTGATDWAAIQAALLSFGTLGGASQGQGGVVYLTPGQGLFHTDKPLIIPSGVRLTGGGWGSQITLATGSNCDIIQAATYNSSAQAAILSVSAGSIANAFWAGVEKLWLHGDGFYTTTAGYHHGINVTTNPLTTAAGSDPDFDPFFITRDVRIEGVTGDGYYHSGRSGAFLERVWSSYHNGNGFTLSFDTTCVDCLAEGTNCGFYLNHGSNTGAGNKSYNNNDQTWVSGHSYSAGNVAVYSGTMYFCILAVSGSTVPSSDGTHWTALSATSPQATGYGWYWDTGSGGHSWAGIEGQQNSAGDFYFKGPLAGAVSIDGTSENVNYNNGQPGYSSANPSHYACVTFDGCSGVNARIASTSQSAGNGIICTLLNTPGKNTLIATTDSTEAATTHGGAPAGFVMINGTAITPGNLVAPPTFTVTAAQEGTTYNGMSVTLRVLTGAAAAQPGAVAGFDSYGATLDQAITPQATGSIVYGAHLGLDSGTFTPTAATTYFQDNESGGYSAGQFRGTAPTTVSTPVTLGSNGTDTGLGVALAEILAAAGATLVEDPSSPAVVAYAAATTQTTAAFQPPPSALLVMMVSAVGSNHPTSGVTAISVTDTSGLGLTWNEVSAQNGNGYGYVGVWAAQVPSGFAPAPLSINDQTPATEASFAAGGSIAGPSGNVGLFWLLAALAGRNLAVCSIPVIGDSITEGMGATLFADRWVSVANRASRSRWPTVANGSSGGWGFIPLTTTGETTYTWPIATAGSGGVIGSRTFGPVRQAVGLSASGTTYTFTAPAGTTSVKVMYYNSGDGAQFSYKVNSGAATTVTASGTAADGALTSSITMTSGDVLTLAWVSGSIWLEGVIHYAGDESSGVTWHGCGHFGWNTGTGGTGWNQTQAQGVDWRASIAALSPSAVAIDLATNDAGVSISAAQSAANLSTLITYLRGNATLAPLPFLLVIPVFGADSASQQYAAGQRGLLASTENLWFIDMNYRILSSGYAPSLYYDALHPDNAGHALYGETAAAGVRIT